MLSVLVVAVVTVVIVVRNDGTFLDVRKRARANVDLGRGGGILRERKGVAQAAHHLLDLLLARHEHEYRAIGQLAVDATRLAVDLLDVVLGRAAVKVYRDRELARIDLDHRRRIGEQQLVLHKVLDAKRSRHDDQLQRPAQLGLSALGLVVVGATQWHDARQQSDENVGVDVAFVSLIQHDRRVSVELAPTRHGYVQHGVGRRRSPSIILLGHRHTVTAGNRSGSHAAAHRRS